MRTRSTLYGIILLLLFAACNIIGFNKPPKDIELSLKSAEIVGSSNQFGFAIFNEVVKSEAADKNIMISPLSISQALSMALNGAKEHTFMEMQGVLGYEGFSLNETNQSNLEITNALIGHDSKVDLKIANSVWYRNNFSVKNDFIKNNTTYYNAEVSGFNPSKPDETKNAINKWVDKNTKGKIEKIIEKVEHQDVMFLINAIYFKAEWKTTFKKSKTQKESFTLDNGISKEVETMIGEVKLNYYNDEKFSVVKLPYGYGKFNMLIFLPEEGCTTADIAPELVNVDFAVLKETPLTSRDIWLPKFEFDYSKKLNDELQAMGMVEAFDENLANLTGIADDLFISKVMHKTYIKTDEEGSEAAAATSVTIGFTSIGPSEIIKIDRSFLFAIVEEDTETILFIGRVYDPSVQQ